MRSGKGPSSGSSCAFDSVRRERDMKAAVLSEIGGSLVIEDLPRPAPRAGEVLVKVTACGVCHTDLHVVKGEVKFPLPAVLGHEISGGVAEIAVVPVADVFPAPSNLPLADACILGCAIMTAYGAVKNQAQVMPGETVAVVGVGGVGSNAIQIARVFGAT